jgi:pyrroline-5-carboxylate reductase
MEHEPSFMSANPILLVGAGRMGGALLDGWAQTGAFAAADIGIFDPHPGEAAARAAEHGSSLTPDLAAARTVLLAVKPQIWRESAADLTPRLAPDAVIVSIAAGVRAADLSAAFGGRRVARVMPTTAVAIGQGTASIYAADGEALDRARTLFAPVATVVELADEALMDAATAVSGSGPAYLYAFVEALEAAGVAAGLDDAASARLARATVQGAAALMAQSGLDPAELRRQVTSPGGTTAAALAVLMGEGGLEPLLQAAVAAAARRSRELG